MLYIALLVSAKQCNQADKNIWDDHGSVNFDQDMSKCCGKYNWKAMQVAACVKNQEKYSQPCSKCFGSIADCVTTHCKKVCDRKSWEDQDCANCRRRKCGQDFTACSGFIPPTDELTPVVASESHPPSCTFEAKELGHQFTSDIASCAFPCLGDANCMAVCIHKKYEYSSLCVDCFVDVGTCVNDKCIATCGVEVGLCEECIGDTCMDEFFKCSSVGSETQIVVWARDIFLQFRLNEHFIT